MFIMSLVLRRLVWNSTSGHKTVPLRNGAMLTGLLTTCPLTVADIVYAVIATPRRSPNDGGRHPSIVRVVVCMEMDVR